MPKTTIFTTVLNDANLTDKQIKALEDRINRVAKGQAVDAEADPNVRDTISTGVTWGKTL